MSNIRNFAIIAHVDHGKSTLADRFLELTGVVKPGEHDEQMLDRNPISRERGITIKLAPVRMEYKLEVKNQKLKVSNNQKIFNFESFILNLIDTPGHVDFSYEVDRTLACVEGVILLVDATAGIQAQTIANAKKAKEKNLAIIPAVNKIDLAGADVEGTKEQIEQLLGVDKQEIFSICAKSGVGVSELLKAAVSKIPPPFLEQQKKREHQSYDLNHNCKQALIFDSYFDPHRGVIAFIRVFSGQFEAGERVRLAASNQLFEVMEVGYFLPDLTKAEVLSCGEIGYVVTNLKDIHKVTVGDSIVEEKGLSSPLPGYQKIRPLVFASIFPTDGEEYPRLKKALEKLYLNDSSLEFKQIYSRSLGAGFRVGFLGLLHADVVRERLEREFALNLLLTPAQVDYHLYQKSQQSAKKTFLEPMVKIMIVTPQRFLGVVMQLCQNYRGKFLTMDNKNQLILYYKLPMSELIGDFYDRLKSISAGYASLDWEFLGYQPVEADVLTILLNGTAVDEFSQIVVKEKALSKAQFLVGRLKELIPRQQFEVKIQAQFAGKIIASEKIAPFRKDVTQKLYGGDRTRKDKLLEKQKKGKKKMKMIGKVQIPKEAFLKLFERS